MYTYNAHIVNRDSMENNKDIHNIIYTNISGYPCILKHSLCLYCKLIN